ncbi:hypothetical protein AS149_12645 [Burkholderia cenocepacia]|nr:hypothetical protein AS149_12645 [Burkholderia cenocepacia]
MTVDFLVQKLGEVGRGREISAVAQGSWMESMVLEVERSLEVRWEWATEPGRLRSEGDDLHIDGSAEWDAEVHRVVRRLKEGVIASSALHAKAQDAPFGLNLDGARLYEPLWRLIQHTACSSCEGSGSGAACASCEGRSEVQCPYCRGRRPEESVACLDAASTKAACRLCNGGGKIACAGCDRTGSTPCSACSGTGEQSRVTRFFVSARESRSIKGETAPNPLLREIIQQALSDETLSGAVSMGEPFEQVAAKGNHLQRYALSLPVCRVRACVHPHVGTVFVAGHKPEVFFGRTVLDELVPALLKSVFARGGLRTFGKASMRGASPGSLLAQLSELISGPRAVKLGIRVDATTATVEGLHAILREHRHALSPEQTKACVLALHEGMSRAREAARGLAVGLGALASLCAAFVAHRHIGPLPAVVPPSLAAVGAFLYATLR